MGNGWSVLGTARSKAEACGQCDGGDRGKLEDEQLAGFYTMIEESLALPFTTRVLGVEVTVAGIDLTDCGIVAICVRKAPPVHTDFRRPAAGPSSAGVRVDRRLSGLGEPGMSEYQ